MVSLKKLPYFSILACFFCLFLQAPSISAEKEIYVRIANDLQSTVISGSAMLITDGNGKEIRLSGAHNFRHRGEGGISVGNTLLRLPVRVTSDAPISRDGRAYRGSFIIKKTQNGFKISNLIDLEQYLRGVVRSEMDTRGPAEAVKAQCVLARTYAAATSGKHGDDDLCDSYHCQVYKGVAGEDPVADRMLEETAGLILRWSGAPASVYYHSDSGGMVTSSAAVWGGAIPYLIPKPEPVAYKGPNTLWELSLPISSVESALSAAGVYTGSIKVLRPTKRDASGRLLKLEIEGTSGKKEITGYAFRNIIGPGRIKSTLFEFGTRSPYAAEPLKRTTSPSAAFPNAAPETAMPAGTKIDLTGMPDDKEEKVVWLTKKSVFTTLELMEILSKPDEIDRYIETGTARAEGRLPMPQPASPGNGTRASGMTESPEFDFTANLSMTPASGSVVTIYGRGAGHGVGLSQRGAMAMAERGWTFERILLYYFPGTTLGQ